MDFKHTSIKQSALGWVKKSIDENLANIRSDLNIYIEDGDASVLGPVRQQLRDIQGVLTMIEQYGAAMLTEEMCSLSQFIADKEQQDDQALEVLLRAVLQLPDYLEHIQAGQKDIPIAILPLLNDIRAAKNEDLFSEKLLFLPDLSMHMDDSEYDAIEDGANQASRLLAKKLRPPYQYSLLGVIKDSDVPVNLKRLEKITEVMEDRASSEQIARFWWIVGALIESVARDDLPLGVSVKMLMGKVDQVFRNMMLKGEKGLLKQQPIDLIKNILYYIAQPECDGPKSQAIKTAYRLEQFLPMDKDQSQASIAGPNQELLKTVSDALQADLEEVKSALEVYVNDDLAKTDQLKNLPAELHVISDTLAMIGLGPQRQVIESQIKVINDVVEGREQADQEKLLAMAAELIQVDQALEMLQKGQMLQPDTPEVTSNTASFNFEMDNMLSAVVTAALDDIQKIKDAILEFIKDSTREENIGLCQTLLLETRGALNLLNQNKAVQVVEGLVNYLKSHDIVEFMDTERLDQLSQVVVSIEYFLEALGEQRKDAESILDFADSRLQLLLQGRQVSTPEQLGEAGADKDLLIEDDEEEFAEEIDEAALSDVDLDNMEADLGGGEPDHSALASDDDRGADEQALEIDFEDQIPETGGNVPAPGVVDSPVGTSGPEGVVEGIESQLAGIQQTLVPGDAGSTAASDAAIMEAPRPEDTDKAVQAALESEATAKDAIAVADVVESAQKEAGETGFAIKPVYDDMPVLKPDSDPDILEIYLEEAEEEAENIRQQQQDWKLHPEDENALKNIRRSFHTIKGSGRLVGAMKIGEFAWDYENLLNRVIDKSVLPSDKVIEAIGLSAEALPQLIEELKTGKGPTADTPYLRGLARALAEFKADKVLEIRQQKQQSDDSTPAQQASAEDAEEPEPGRADAETSIGGPEESDGEPENSGIVPEPEVAAFAVGESVAVAESAPEPAETDQTQTGPEHTEELPSDPFVLNEAASPPPVESGARAGLPEIPTMEEEGLQLDPELLVIYQQEVESHLSTVNSALEKSAAEGELVPSEELYRALHTINGASRTADIKPIGALATLLEKPLKIILEQGAALDREVLGLYRRGHDEIKRMTAFLVAHRQMPELPADLLQDLENLLEQMEDHTVELPDQEDQPSSQFVDTLTMMNEQATPDYDDELVEIFIDEATDLLEMSDHTLQAWAEQDDEQDDKPGFGLVMELQRYLHTLKGGAKMAEFGPISDLSHELESLFIAVIDNRVDKTEDLIDCLHESFDLLNRQVEQAKNHQPMDSSAEQIASLRRVRQGDTSPSQASTASGISASAQDLPTPVESASEEFAPAADQQRDAGESSKGDRRASDRDVVKVRSDLLDNLVNSAGEVSIYRARMEQQVASFGSHLGELGQTIQRLKNQLRALEAETDAQIHYSDRQDAKVSKSFDPLEMDRYTQIQELSKSLSESVDDLSSLQSILGEQVKDSETLLLQQSRINTDLQDGLIRSRMVRFAGMVSRLRRLVRQTSSELAKKAELEVRGEQNEIDIKVLDRMIAPLEHIIRNAIAHGIESPIQRVNKGKPETGTITIDVSRDGSDVVVRISDDGAGVNVDKVRSRALELGLLRPDEELDDNDIIQFILEPGFSTAEQVSQVSGRGVGMDVVDSNIKQLGGTLQISTSPNGSVFTARLPFTLSINQAILVRAGEESYALPLINIEGITRIESDQMMEYYMMERPVLDYAGQQYALHYLSALLDISTEFHVTDPMLKVPVILLRSGDLRIALHIDEIIGNREIVVKPLGVQLGQVKGLSGASILADGMVVLILDINGLIRHGVATQVVVERPVQQVVEEKKSANKTVMVVDDSITMRRVASKLLTRNNYDVLTAKDGVDALAQLDEHKPDVMLLDIEMPRMDGFELASHMKNSPELRDIPIIMITSRTGTKHRDHAMQLGVDKYMGKPYQEEELIGNISALVG